MESLLIKTDLPVDSGVRVKSVAGMGDPKRMLLAGTTTCRGPGGNNQASRAGRCER